MFPKTSKKNKPTNSRGTLGDSRGHRSKLTDKKTNSPSEKGQKNFYCLREEEKKKPNFLSVRETKLLFLINVG